jgi:hypothetical protein
MKMTTLVQLSFYRDNENFQLSFDLKEESLGEIFDKLEIMLAALGFVLDGKMLNLIDKETASNTKPDFLSEDFNYDYVLTTSETGDKVPFTVHPGGKE